MTDTDSPMAKRLDATVAMVVQAMHTARNPKLGHLLQLWADLEIVRPVIAEGNEATAVGMLHLIYSEYAARVGEDTCH